MYMWGVPRKFRGAAIDRLAAYEDTGLTPEKVEILSCSYPKIFDMVDELNEYRDIGTIKHLQKLVKAEQDGRLVVLPCKVGDTVFDMADGTPYETRVLSFSYFGDVFWACRTASSYPDLQEFGKIIFLTREESEAALKNRKEAGNGAD